MRTRFRYKARAIYRELDRPRFWYVDEGHPGPSAHLEVFSFSGEHLGEATVLGVLDTTKADQDKKLRFVN